MIMDREEQVEAAAFDKAIELNEYRKHNSTSIGDIAMKAFTAGAEWADAHPKNPWISVKDKPKESGWVFVAGGAYSYRALFYCAGKFYSDVSLGTYDSDVTHWMSIP